MARTIVFMYIRHKSNGDNKWQWGKYELLSFWKLECIILLKELR